MQLHVASPSPATNRGELRDAVRMPNPAYCMGRPGPVRASEVQSI